MMKRSAFLCATLVILSQVVLGLSAPQGVSEPYGARRGPARYQLTSEIPIMTPIVVTARRPSVEIMRQSDYGGNVDLEENQGAEELDPIGFIPYPVKPVMESASIPDTSPRVIETNDIRPEPVDEKKSEEKKSEEKKPSPETEMRYPGRGFLQTWLAGPMRKIEMGRNMLGVASRVFRSLNDSRRSIINTLQKTFNLSKIAQQINNERRFRDDTKSSNATGRSELTSLQRTSRQSASKEGRESAEDKKNRENDDSNESGGNSSSDESEPPGGGDGQGGGLIGLLAGLSGEGGQSDLGTLLTTVASILGNLSGGEGFDLNVLIGSAVALLAGILGGDGSQNIGTQIGIYLNTIFNGITGGGAMNNGAFIGNFLATLIGGSSGAGGGSSEEEAGGKDSGTFFVSLISSLLGSSSG